MEPLLTVNEVAKLLRVSRGWIYDHLERREPFLPHYKIGGIVRFSEHELLKFIQLEEGKYGNEERRDSVVQRML